jgi:hypothetical protein
MHSTVSRGKFKGVELTPHHKKLFKEAALAGKFKPFEGFLKQGGNPNQLRNLDFPRGRTLRQVAEGSNSNAVKMLETYGLV